MVVEGKSEEGGAHGGVKVGHEGADLTKEGTAVNTYLCKELHSYRTSKYNLSKT